MESRQHHTWFFSRTKNTENQIEATQKIEMVIKKCNILDSCEIEVKLDKQTNSKISKHQYTDSSMNW